jgi:C1A family cysteine protease
MKSKNGVISPILAALLFIGVSAAVLLLSGALNHDNTGPTPPPIVGEQISWQFTGDKQPKNGAGTEIDLRKALFDSDLDPLGGPAELLITLPADGTPLTLKLEARNTTGYLWEVVSGKGLSFTQQGEASFEQRYKGFGAPAIQTITLKANGKGSAVARLVYHRPFEADAAPRRSLSLTYPDPQQTIDLTDLTPEQEIISEDTQPEEALVIPHLKGLPSKLDWRDKGIVTEIKDQGSCGSCWAFGTVGIMESALAKAGKGLKNLSEQFLVSCNTRGWNCSRGGLTASMFHTDTLAKSQTKVGAVLETTKPYTATDGSCTVSYEHPYKLSKWSFIGGTNDWAMPTTQELKDAIYAYGPVMAGVCVGPGWYGYKGGVYGTNDTNCGTWSNHYVILVGWDDTLGSNGVWIIKNSFGTNWGDKGYMYLPYGYSLVGQGASWARAISTNVPKTQSPVGTVKTVNPTYTWTPINGASIYQYQVWQGSTIILDKSPDTEVCSAKICERTPKQSLEVGVTYKWRVRAFVAGGWKAWSAFSEFTVTQP